MKKEFNILNYFNMRGLFLGIGLSRILISSKENILITLILGTLIGLLILKIFNKGVKNNFITLLVNMSVILLGLIILVNMISTMYLTNTPKYLIIIPFIILILYVLFKDEILIYRISNILLVLNLFLYVVSFFSLIKYIRIDNFYYTNTSIFKVILSSIEYALFSTIPTITSKSDKTNYPLYKTYIISSMTMGLIFIFTIGVLGSNYIDILRYPEYIILKNVSIANIFENIENIVSFMWIFDIFILILSSGNSIKEVIKDKKYLVIIFSILTILTIFINLYYELIISTYNYCPIILLVLLILLFINKKKSLT